MFWRDIKDIKEWTELLDERLSKINYGLETLDAHSNRQAEVILAEATLDKFEDYMKNVDKLNAMINEFKGCVSMARASVQEKKDTDIEIKNDIVSLLRANSCLKSCIDKGLVDGYFNKMDEIYKLLFGEEKMDKYKIDDLSSKIDAIYKTLCIKKESKKKKAS